MVRFYLLLGLIVTIIMKVKSRQKYPHYALKGGAIFAERRAPTKTVNDSPLLGLILQTKIL